MTYEQMVPWSAVLLLGFASPVEAQLELVRMDFAGVVSDSSEILGIPLGARIEGVIPWDRTLEDLDLSASVGVYEDDLPCRQNPQAEFHAEDPPPIWWFCDEGSIVVYWVHDDAPEMPDVDFFGIEMTASAFGTDHTFLGDFSVKLMFVDSTATVFESDSLPRQLELSDFDVATMTLFPIGSMEPDMAVSIDAVSTTVVGVMDDTAPSLMPYVLQNNVPNPFSRSTMIEYEANVAAAVSLNVFDTAGRLVRVLQDELTPEPGRRVTRWDGTAKDGRHVSSGVYYYRLTVGEWSDTRKMVLIGD